MKKLKMIFAFVLALAMVFCLAACAEKQDPEESTTGTGATSALETTNPGTEPSETEPSVTEPSETEPSQSESIPVTENTDATGAVPSDYAYVIKVVDADGNGVAGAFVQLCDDHGCKPMPTDANGIAGYSEGGEGQLKAQLLNVPSGYAMCEETIVYFEDGQTEVVFTVTAA